MPNVIYHGDQVNSIISSIQNISNLIPSISSSLKSATNTIVSAKGFNQYVGGVSSDTFSSAAEECEDQIQEFVKNLRQKQISILAYSEDKEEINAFLDTLSNSDYSTLDLNELDSYIGLDRKAGNVARGIFSTIGTFGLGLLEGIGNLIETGGDLIYLGATGAASIFTGAYDLLTGEHATEDMWNSTKAFVSEKHVESIFDSIYEDTEFGQSLKNNAYLFDGARSVGSGLGYTAGMIGLTVLTGGLASGLGVGAAGSVGAGQLAATAGLLGFSRGTQDAWADGADIGSGLLYGAASGAWEGVQWYAGAKINQINGLGDKIAQGIFKGAAKGVGVRVGLDVVDSALEGFVQPALSMIYKDYGQGDFVENYKTAFEEAGGWATVGTHAVMGGIASVAGEYLGARRLLKEADNSKQIFESEGGNGGKHLLGEVDDNSPELMGYRDQQGKEIFFRKNTVDGNGGVYTPRQHIDPEYQKQLTDTINQTIRNNGEATFTFKTTKELTSDVLEGVEDLSKLKVQIVGGFADLDGNIKAKYLDSGVFVDRATYSGYEALSIVKKIESLESRIDMSLPPTERAKQIGDIVSEYTYSKQFSGVPKGSVQYDDAHKVVSSLRGITSNNALGEEGLVCAGYSQLYKELCERSDVPCDYIRGYAVDSTGSGVHVWNVVKGTNGEVIPVDCTEHANGVKTWFGQSDSFSARHIANEDEMFRNYSPSSTTVEYIKTTMDSAYGQGSGGVGLLKYVVTGDETSITSRGNARYYATQLTTPQIGDYIDHMSRSERNYTIMATIQSVIQDQYGAYADRQFQYFANTGDTDFLPPLLKKVAEKYLKKSDIDSYLVNYYRR